MKILILGAGRVGESVAESLVSERNDITVTVIDTDPTRPACVRCRTGWTCAASSATASSPACCRKPASKTPTC